MQYHPILILALIGFTVGTLQWRKAERFSGLKRRLALAVTMCTYATCFSILLVFLTQSLDMPGPGPMIILSILLAIAFWTAGLIWAGPAEYEDKWVFKSTVGLVILMPVVGFLF